MKKATLRVLYLCIIFLLILSACGPDATIELPPEDAQVQEADPPEVDEASWEHLLHVGTTMKWYDDSYVVYVPEGEVTQGDNEYDNNPEHSVYLDGFWIYIFEVTNGQYRHCVATGTCTPPASEPPYPDIDNLEIKDQPVIGVTWEQAETYCNWMNGRLPTEAQWEKTARGPEANTYPWGEEDPDCDLLNYGDCELPEIAEVYDHLEGMSYYEAYDMAGNTYEWVYDWYDEDYPNQVLGPNPTGPGDGEERSVRGSSYKSGEDLIPSARRYFLEPEKYRTDLGFRCVIGEGELDPFASPCIQTAFVDGLPAPWQPGPPTGGTDPKDIDGLMCNPQKVVTWIPYCGSEDTQQGGVDITITGVNGSDAYLKSYGSNQAVYCAEENDPIGCFGPEGAVVSVEICASCTPPLLISIGHHSCDSGFTITHTDPPKCVYDGGPPVPGGACPAGFVYDLANDICVKIVTESDECPAGYEYDPDTDCCVATFADPSPDSQSASSSYLTCPPGYGNTQLQGQDSNEGDSYATCIYHVSPADIEECEGMTFTLGMCDDPPKQNADCSNPSFYTAQGPCEAAMCKWIPDPAVGGICVLP